MFEVRDGRYAFWQHGVARMGSALRGSAARIPVYAQMHECVAEQCAIPRREFFARPDLLVPATLEVQERFGLDVAAVTYDVYNLEAEALGPVFYKIYANEHGAPLILGVGAGFLARARPADVVERVARYVAVGARGGRFALYLRNPGAGTPPENVRAAVDTAHAASMN